MNKILVADYNNKKHAKDIIDLLNQYARHPMGGGSELIQSTKDNLVTKLKNFPGAFSILVYNRGQAIGLANCFMGFSTFQSKPLINIHDIYVLDSYQGKNIGQEILQEVQNIAIEKQCCKITLEVLEGNLFAQKAYQSFGFISYELKPEFGKAIFLEKKL
ncbi:MAG: GNAT family N-acetyltransferase [Gammaproteobacteria bacterium]|nr:GNAT family N-acetyltransferase [Gammaproteobacteria bacterium]